MSSTTFSLASAAALVAAVTVWPGAAVAAKPKPPSATTIRTATRTVVERSGAHVVKLEVVPPDRAYVLTVQATDPAAYLRHRFARVIAVADALTNSHVHFRVRTFAVVDGAGGRVFWVRQTKNARGRLTEWSLRTDLQRCVLRLPFGLELDIGPHTPACPAP